MDFHVEDRNFPSVNINHTGDIKDWIMQEFVQPKLFLYNIYLKQHTAEYAHSFEKLCEELFRESYKWCKAAHIFWQVIIWLLFWQHNIFGVFHQILQTSNPPIPIHWIRQLPGEYADSKPLIWGLPHGNKYCVAICSVGERIRPGS